MTHFEQWLEGYPKRGPEGDYDTARAPLLSRLAEMTRQMGALRAALEQPEQCTYCSKGKPCQCVDGEPVAQPANQDASDAARYRWLRDSQADWQICYWSDEFDAWQDVQTAERNNIDSAIDAAMKEKNNG